MNLMNQNFALFVFKHIKNYLPKQIHQQWAISWIADIAINLMIFHINGGRRLLRARWSGSGNRHLWISIEHLLLVRWKDGMLLLYVRWSILSRWLLLSQTVCLAQRFLQLTIHNLIVMNEILRWRLGEDAFCLGYPSFDWRSSCVINGELGVMWTPVSSLWLCSFRGVSIGRGINKIRR